MQAFQDWVPPRGTLGEILAETRERVAVLESGRPSRGQPVPIPAASSRVRDLRPPLLSTALGQANVAVIGEVKRSSPSRGALNISLGAAEQARRFERGGAAAASILTEPRHFGGSLADLREAAHATTFPLLKKDFHVSPVQLEEAFEGEASALLLIARALPPRDLQLMILAAKGLRIEPVVEVRTEDELRLALSFGAGIVGVNARDLETLEVDETVPERLIPMIPPDVIAIWESGISGRADVERAAAAGADAVLVGSALSLAAEPEALLATLTTVPRRRRG